MKSLLILLLLFLLFYCLFGCGGAPIAADVVLTFTAPGDDGDVGTAAEYDIRISDSMITANNFNIATELTGEPTPSIAGTKESYTMAPLSSGIYYLAIKTRDESFNWSALSNVLMLDIDNIEPATITDLGTQ